MPKIVDHDQYRKELTQAALKVFAKSGYANVSMRSLAVALGVSTGTLYHYFPTKEALFKDVMLFPVELGSEQIPLEIISLPLEARLKALFDFIQAHEANFQVQIQLMLDYQQANGLEHPEAQEISRQHRQIIALLTGLSDEIVTIIFSQILGLVLLRMVEGSSQDLFVQAKPLLKWIGEQV